MKSDSKQMRVSKAQYDLLGSLAEDLGMSRTDILSNVIALAKFLHENQASSVRVRANSGEEKEFIVPMLVRGK